MGKQVLSVSRTVGRMEGQQGSNNGAIIQSRSCVVGQG